MMSMVLFWLSNLHFEQLLCSIKQYDCQSFSLLQQPLHFPFQVMTRSVSNNYAFKRMFMNVHRAFDN